MAPTRTAHRHEPPPNEPPDHRTDDRPSPRPIGRTGVALSRDLWRGTVIATRAAVAWTAPRAALAFKATVIALFFVWFYLTVMAGTIASRLDRGPAAPRLRGVRPLALGFLVVALATAGTTTLAREAPRWDGPRPKVVVVVGPVGDKTDEYESAGRRLAWHASRMGARVTGIYPPRATWDRVQRAARGADLFIYLGHGNGWPSPYPPFQTVTKNGLGLNPYRGAPNGPHRYYGERYVDGLRLANDSVVLLVGLCYASGNAEMHLPIPSRHVARQRVDHYAAGFIRAGARAVFSDGFGDSTYVLDGLFRSNRTMEGIFWSGWRATGVDVTHFRSRRSPGMTGILDPQVDGDYYHSFLGDTDFRAARWRGEAPGGGGEGGSPDREPPAPDDGDGDGEDPGDGVPRDPEPTPADRRRTIGHLNLRSGPGIEHRIVGWVLRGTDVTVLRVRSLDGPPDWLRVRLPDGQEGWVWGQWVGPSR